MELRSLPDGTQVELFTFYGDYAYVAYFLKTKGADSDTFAAFGRLMDSHRNTKIENDSFRSDTIPKELYLEKIQSLNNEIENLNKRFEWEMQNGRLEYRKLEDELTEYKKKLFLLIEKI